MGLVERMARGWLTGLSVGVHLAWWIGVEVGVARGSWCSGLVVGVARGWHTCLEVGVARGSAP